MYDNPSPTNTNNLFKPQSLQTQIVTMKQNFLMRDVEIVPGLYFNQYNTIKRAYFYSHNQFESGPLDENGQPKYFFDLMTDRNDQATKNIDLDTKDCYIQAKNGGSYVLSWLLRQEFMAFAQQTGFGMKLNDLASDLPEFGTVVWKKCYDENGNVDIQEVELINLINDPQAKTLKDGIVIERHLMTQSEMKSMKSWNKKAVNSLIDRGQNVIPARFMEINGMDQNRYFNMIDTTTPYYEVYEMWGEMPKNLYKKYQHAMSREDYKGSIEEYDGYDLKGEQRNGFSYDIDQEDDLYEDELNDPDSSNDMVYVLAQVAGVQQGGEECVLFLKEVDKDKKFPYKEVHYRRRKGRWLGVGNYELCFDQIEKANEVTNRFFSALRLSLLHIYQTRDALHVKNVLTDLLDGDVVVSKSEILAIPTEVRGLADYKDEIERIENKCNHLCNTFEVVSGENLPSGTSFQLGQQMLNSATKLFEFVRENMGLFIEMVFNEWLMPGFVDTLDNEHVLELLDADDLKIYYEARKRLVQYETIKKFVMETGELPSPEQIDLVGALAKDQLSKSPKQILVGKGDYDMATVLSYKLKVVTTGENSARKENVATLTTTLETVMANPAALQDPRAMKLLGMVLEEVGFSPLQINLLNETPTNPLLNPANQGGAAAGQRSSITSPQNGQPAGPSGTGAPVNA